MSLHYEKGNQMVKFYFILLVFEQFYCKVWLVFHSSYLLVINRKETRLMNYIEDAGFNSNPSSHVHFEKKNKIETLVNSKVVEKKLRYLDVLYCFVFCFCYFDLDF